MRILVFDDSPANRETAKISLAGHDLTVVGTYDEAQAALLPKPDHARQIALFREKYGNVNPCDCEDPAEKAVRMEYYEECREKTTSFPSFDAVLTDLMVPASKRAQGRTGAQFIGQEMPLGTTIALLALAAGIKNVAVATDINHHCHPASAAFDCFDEFGKNRNPNIKILCTNRVWMIGIDEATGKVVDRDFLNKEESKRKYPYVDDYSRREGLREGKDWGEILKELLAGESGS